MTCEQAGAGLRCPTCGVHSALGNLLGVLEELGFGGSWVSEQQHVDVATQAMTACGVLLLAAKQGQRNASLDIVPKNFSPSLVLFDKSPKKPTQGMDKVSLCFRLRQI